MTVQLNFLPWRGLRVSCRRRFWLSLSGAGALLIFVYLYLASLLLSLTHQHTLIVGQSLAELQHHGQQHITILSQQQSDWQQTLTFFRHYQAGQQRVRQWLLDLQFLAKQLPTDAWLTRLETRAGLVNVEGRALSSPGALGVEAHLSQWPGFSGLRPGVIERDAGQVVFSFLLAREVDGALD